MYSVYTYNRSIMLIDQQTFWKTNIFSRNARHAQMHKKCKMKGSRVLLAHWRKQNQNGGLSVSPVGIIFFKTIPISKRFKWEGKCPPLSHGILPHLCHSMRSLWFASTIYWKSKNVAGCVFRETNLNMTLAWEPMRKMAQAPILCSDWGSKVQVMLESSEEYCRSY